MKQHVGLFDQKQFNCPVRARFLKNLLWPLAVLVFIALSLALLPRRRHPDLRPEAHPEPLESEEEVEEWTTNDNGKQEWPQGRAAREDRAIVYVARASRLKELALSAELLFLAFNDRLRYRVLVFHGPDLNRQAALEALNTRLEANQLALIELVRLEDFYTFPSGFDRRTIEKDRSQIVAGEHFPKYQRISAFWFRGVFLQSRLQSVKYIMRLDTESRLLGTIEYDLFDYMEKNGLKYAYRARHREDDCCARHLFHAVRDFMFDYRLGGSVSRELAFLVNETDASVGAEPKTNNPIGRQPHAYVGGLELLHVPSFRGVGAGEPAGGPIVWAWPQETWSDLRYEGIYRLRWNDGFLRFQGVQLFQQLHRHTHMLCDLHYQHGAQAFPATCNFTETPKSQWPVPRFAPRIEAYNYWCHKTGLSDCGHPVQNFEI